MIYLDYQATTPLAPEAFAAMEPWLKDGFANPHSAHAAGRAAAAAVEVARDQIAAAHDLSDGGLAVAISEMALAAKIGATINIPEDYFVHLFSETPGRILIAIESEKVDEFIGRAIDLEITTTRIGKTGGDQLIFENLFSISIAEMHKVNSETLPRLFG